MRVGFIQFDPIFGEVKQNLDAVGTKLAQVECDLMVLPELFASGYQFVSKREVELLAESVPGGPTTSRLIEIARERQMFVAAGLPEKAQGRYYNSAAIVGPAGLIGLYRKTHLFFEETLYFSPGDTGFSVWDLGPAKVGLLVCFDWVYPEAARTLALKGAEVLCHPSNLVLPHCPDAMVTRCLENRVFSVTANRIGCEQRGGKERLTYIGQSEVVSPKGHILYRASANAEDTTILEINPAEARDKQLNAYNELLRDRRPDRYEL
jgi:5-aminopentanamidase